MKSATPPSYAVYDGTSGWIPHDDIAARANAGKLDTIFPKRSGSSPTWAPTPQAPLSGANDRVYPPALWEKRRRRASFKAICGPTTFFMSMPLPLRTIRRPETHCRSPLPISTRTESCGRELGMSNGSSVTIRPRIPWGSSVNRQQIRSGRLPFRDRRHSMCSRLAASPIFLGISIPRRFLALSEA